MPPVLHATERQRDEPETEPVYQAERREAQQVQRGHEVVDLAVVERTDPGPDPPHLVPEADLADEVEDVGVAGEEVVIAALEAGAPDVKGGCLPAEERRSLVHRHVVTALA